MMYKAKIAAVVLAWLTALAARQDAGAVKLLEQIKGGQK
jgi:hypothetical protein